MEGVTRCADRQELPRTQLILSCVASREAPPHATPRRTHHHRSFMPRPPRSYLFPPPFSPTITCATYHSLSPLYPTSPCYSPPSPAPVHTFLEPTLSYQPQPSLPSNHKTHIFFLFPSQSLRFLFSTSSFTLEGKICF